MRATALPTPAGGGLLEADAFGADHVDDLASPGDDLAEGLGGGVWLRPPLRTDALGEQGDHGGIELVGFGQAAARASEVADLAGVDRQHR